jgi:hypothetical protein
VYVHSLDQRSFVKFTWFVQADVDKPIKHFHPRFPPEADPSLSLASAIFAAFAFQKGPAERPASAAEHPYPGKLANML